MILVDSQIKAALKSKDLVIKPFDNSSLGSNSYDVHLSKHLSIYKVNDYLDPKKENQIEEIIIPEEGYVLQPGILYLASTEEYTECHKYVPILEGKSSIGRLGLTIHVTAGFGDIGFCGHWTLEMSTIHPLKVYKGMSIGQISFHTCGIPEISYKQKTSSKYNNTTIKPIISKLYTENSNQKQVNLEPKESIKKINKFNPNLKNQEFLDKFYYWMHERQTMFISRYLEDKPFPWTEDEALKNNKFTNVHRDLDRHTAYYLNFILPTLKSSRNLKTQFFMTIVWRMINNPAVFEVCGILKDLDNWSEYKEQVRLRMHSLDKPFCSAYIINPYRKEIGNVNGYLDITFQWLLENIDYLMEPWFEGNVKESFKRLTDIPRSGNFISYEIWCDLIHLKLNEWNANSFVNVGPGCKLGLSFVFPSLSGNNALVDAIYWLRDSTNEHLDRLNYNYGFITPKRTYTLRDIEHSLCEFSKYCKLIDPNKKPRKRLYKPSPEKDWLDTYYKENIIIYRHNDR